MQVEKLKTIDADTLLSTPMRKTLFVVDGLIPQGLSVLSGSSKIGKSWLMLWLGIQVARGQPVWEFETHKSDVLYLCLEDTYARIQSRLYQITDEAPPELRIATTSFQIANGLEQQIEQYLSDFPKTKLVIIDTFQKVRDSKSTGGKSGMYAGDYDDVTALKNISDKYGIAVVVVHHVRKLKDVSDPFNEVSGSTGMKQLGYVIDLNPYHKYATIRSVNSKKETRLYRLGEAYDRDAIYDQMRDTLRNNPQEAYRLYYEFTEKKSFGVTIQKAHFVKGNLKTAKKITGLKALYFRYLYLLGVLPKNKKHNPLSPEMREACRWLDRHTAQVQLICDNHLTDISSVEVFIKHTDSEIKLISDYRKMLYRDIDSCHDPDEKTKLVVKRDDCTKALAQLRKDRKTAARIIEDNPKIKENILIEENMRSRYFGLNKSRKRGYER